MSTTYSRDEATKLVYADSSKLSTTAEKPKNLLIPLNFPSYSPEESLSLINNISFKQSSYIGEEEISSNSSRETREVREQKYSKNKSKSKKAR